MRIPGRFRRPVAARLILSVSYILDTAGLTVLAFDNLLYDQWAVFGAGTATLCVLVFILFTGYAALWLAVGAAWTYATIIEAVRGPSTLDRIGLCMIFAAMAAEAFAAYSGDRRAQREARQ
ncbi:MAG: hypothetical protein FWE15_30595 [Actinomycetia bacterium]|nr:hypothetical protein [Actinomycetes bacterium]